MFDSLIDYNRARIWILPIKIKSVRPAVEYGDIIGNKGSNFLFPARHGHSIFSFSVIYQNMDTNELETKRRNQIER